MRRGQGSVRVSFHGERPRVSVGTASCTVMPSGRLLMAPTKRLPSRRLPSPAHRGRDTPSGALRQGLAFRLPGRCAAIPRRPGLRPTPSSGPYLRPSVPPPTPPPIPSSSSSLRVSVRPPPLPTPELRPPLSGGRPLALSLRCDQVTPDSESRVRFIDDNSIRYARGARRDPARPRLPPRSESSRRSSAARTLRRLSIPTGPGPVKTGRDFGSEPGRGRHDFGSNSQLAVRTLDRASCNVT